jgi:hypothetical protein
MLVVTHESLIAFGVQWMYRPWRPYHDTTLSSYPEFTMHQSWSSRYVTDYSLPV